MTATGAPSLHIRSFAPADEPAVIALWDRCGLLRPWNDPRRDIARKALVQPELFVVGVDAGAPAPVAAAMAGWDGHRGWINYLAVDPAHRGRGHGRALVQHLERALADVGCPKLNLQVRTTNAAVLAFYQRLGYGRDDVVCMSRRLIVDDPASPAT